MEKLPSFVVLLVLLVPFCAAQNDEFRDNNNNKELIYPRNVEATWKKFMVRMLKNIRNPREAARRKLMLSQSPYPVTVDPLGEDLGDSNNVDKAVSSTTSTCSVPWWSSCTAFASLTVTESSHQSSVSTGTTNNSSNNSNSNNSNSSTSTSGGGTATSSNNSSSSSSSSSG